MFYDVRRNTKKIYYFDIPKTQHWTDVSFVRKVTIFNFAKNKNKWNVDEYNTISNISK